MWEDLEGEGEADEVAAEAGEEAVVVAASASEACALGSEGHAGDEGELDGGVVGVEWAEGFLYAEGGAGGERAVTQIDVESEVVALDGGEKDGVAFGMKSVDEVVGADFIRQGVVEEEGEGRV